ncbi:MAG: hypothetical protein Q9217_006300 [Psora testacea]
MAKCIRPGIALPDPTADLHWSSFAGPIQDVFAAIATRHPSRLCVVETASSISKQRDFTYQQIHQASNVIAYHLIQHGIQREEIVSIYGYRGVDLVVSIIGVLKAGAAFSVIDPAYPPDRQIIYLDVSRPRAILVIDKALREEGMLSEKVRTWINENLDLRSQVPALELLDDGTLKGGSLKDGGADVLREQQPLKDKHPGIIVGPDTQPTLSFTSGSEGIPKGCRGRHFSLTYYYDFMQKEFMLSENDTFTMLSGIAHDPIQRDIFTPLYFGAKLLVPAKENIQHEELAEWMKEHKPSITHLTPAMGQLLVGGATTTLEHLKHAFFVGDVLTKRDCRLLQALAPNCRIVNMFGSTETQRAVSFYKLPSLNEDPQYLKEMEDMIPAGRGMRDVQLLVVDRNSLQEQHPRLCHVGEVGEIFVRAGGLAEGYLGLGSDVLNRQKFVSNFFLKDHSAWMEADKRLAQEGHQPWRDFWKGPRDRLYKSGDVGFYDANGDVHCTGRADNQVKIRGFRIELGEIDSHLSSHPLIRENLTLLRRDQDEEPTLVSYLVPELSEWSRWLEKRGLADDRHDETMVGMLKRFQGLRDDVRAFLRMKLASYAVPSVFVPLRKFPLNPNGKVDRKALPYPDPIELLAAATTGKLARDAFKTTERLVAEVWVQRIPGISNDMIRPDDHFFDIGGHSMLAQSILFDLRKQKSISLPMQTLLQNPTLRQFAAMLDEASHVRNEDNARIPEVDYHLDGEDINAKFHQRPILPRTDPLQTILLTGATGFLGAHILRDLLKRHPRLQVCALVRGESDGMKRIKETCEAYGIWDESWLHSGRLDVAVGDLSKPQLGMEPEIWNRLASSVDCVIHAGARVHWLQTYSVLNSVNVLATLSCIEFCSTSRPKHLTFMSSTAVLGTPHYLDKTILESDDLSLSRKGLSNGYAQTKYVSEYLIREAGRRGLRGSIVRSGYLTGDPLVGLGPTDDFLLRMLKGSIQLGSYPNLSPNTINLVPVSHCARIVVAASLHPPIPEGVSVVQVTPHPQLPFNTFLSTLEVYNYNCRIAPYAQWRKDLEEYVADQTSSSTSTANTTSTTAVVPAEKEPHALLPLFDWVTSDLPADTQSRTLDDRNAGYVLRADGMGDEWQECSRVTQETVSTYLAFMVSIGFIPPPPNLCEDEDEKACRKVKSLPRIEISNEQKKALAAVGRAEGK